ncbi:hypothetical protein ACH4CC_33280 [Streptomyces lydicus]|uniref:hypothetical protein n=1 Tax=Streptomyces lydicus TaxID=47763 RepID=UPI0037B8C066
MGPGLGGEQQAPEGHQRVRNHLLDLWRDRDGGTWNRAIALLSTHHVSTFRKYLTLRSTANLGTGGKTRQILRNHTINY